MLANWRQLSLVSLGALVIKAIGLLRGIIVAGFIGANGFLDAYYGVLVIVGFFIFVFADQLEMLISEVGAGRENLLEFARDALTTVLGVSVLITVLLYISLPFLLPILLPELKSDQYDFACNVTALISLLCFAYAPYRVLLALFRCRGLVGTQVGIDSINSVLFCGFTIPVLYLCRDMSASLKVLALSASHSAAFISAFVIGLIVWKINIRQRVWGRFSISLIRELGTKALTLAGAHYALYVFIFVDRFFAGCAIPGGISLLGYAGNVSLTARSLINFEQIYLIDFARSQDKASTFRYALLQNAALSSVVGIFLFVYSGEILRLIYERGAFTPQMSIDASQILAIYGLSTLPFLWWGLLFRALQVQGSLGKLPIFILLLAPIDLLITYISVTWLGIGGAVLGTLICYLALVIWGLLCLKRTLGVAVIRPTHAVLILLLNLTLLLVALQIKKLTFSSSSLLEFICEGLIFSVVSVGLIFGFQSQSRKVSRSSSS